MQLVFWKFLQLFCMSVSFLGGMTMAETIQILLEFEYKQVRVELEDNKASREFMAQLPLNLEFSDYAGKEKVAHLQQSLSVRNTSGYDPQIGDFFYFAPWGNIGIFYAKQPPYNGLVYLGKLSNAKDLQSLKSLKANFRVKITRQEAQ